MKFNSTFKNLKFLVFPPHLLSHLVHKKLSLTSAWCSALPSPLRIPRLRRCRIRSFQSIAIRTCLRSLLTPGANLRASIRVAHLVTGRTPSTPPTLHVPRGSCPPCVPSKWMLRLRHAGPQPPCPMLSPKLKHLPIPEGLWNREREKGKKNVFQGTR